MTPIYALDLIIKKRDGQPLSDAEIDFLFSSYTAGLIPDYQLSALLMAIYLRGFNFAETRAATRAFINSGEVVDLSDLPGIKVDKHSTGGVGDKTTLVVVPLVAAAGLTVVKMSGRSLGHTGGTLDKLSSIPGFRTDLSLTEVKEVARRIGAVLAGQTANLVPADKKIYALRDVTGTVDCLPLIAISIMSKKIASGADRVVLDVKVGSGALLPELGRARELAEWMVSLGKEFHRPTTAVLSNMDQPLGRQVGNALEVKEAIETLRGEGPADLTALSLELGSQMLLVSGVVTDAESGRKQLAQLLKVGAGLDKLKEIIANQSGDPAVVDDLSLLPRAHDRVVIPASTAGFVQMIDARTIGWASQLLGAGRLRMEDSVDLAVGITLNKKVGDPVVAGEPLAVLHFNNPERLVEVSDQVSRAFLIGALPPTNSPLIYEIIS